jgi:pimeloyl-ACP methyl ester carboxylesterase
MALQTDTITIDGSATRIRKDLGRGGTPLLFLHGGVPGITPYCGGSHIWGPVLAAFAEERPVIALDLPGSGGSALPAGQLPSIDGWGRHVLAVLDHLGLARCHVVGHEEGGLLALWLAMQAPERAQSVSVVASRAAAPSGDMIENITFAHPPEPLWGRVSQAWALDRISYKHDHIDGALLDACAEQAQTDAFRRLAAAMRDGGYYKVFVPSVGAAKARFYATCRGDGIPVPVQLIWASHDPLTPPERGIGLFRDIAPGQPTTVFDLINRSGNLIFREQPGDFFRTVSGFVDSLQKAG